MRRSLAVLFVILDLACGTYAYAAGGPSQVADSEGQSAPDHHPAARTTFFFRLDNDALAKLPSDTNYTMGVSLKWIASGPKNGNWIDAWPLFPVLDFTRRYWILPTPRLTEGALGPSRGVEWADDAFTPQCLHTAATCAAEGKPITQDRPYANVIWNGVSYHQFDSKSGEGWSAEFDVGILGTSIGRVVQTRIHEYCCKEKIPQEWGTQIGNGGALTFLIKQINEKRLKEWADGDVDLRIRYGIWLGWYTWPTVGLVASFYNVLRIEGDASYVLYDQLLQGAWGGTNPITYKRSELEPVVTLSHMRLDLIGLTRLLMKSERSNWGLSYAQHWKSRDLKVGGVESRHRWGGLEFRYTY